MMFLGLGRGLQVPAHHQVCWGFSGGEALGLRAVRFGEREGCVKTCFGAVFRKKRRRGGEAHI